MKRELKIDNCRLTIANCPTAPPSKIRDCQLSIVNLQFPVMVLLLAAPCAAAQSITDTSVHLPPLEDVVHVLLLRDYNTRLVVLSTAVLGIAAGLIGSFLLLRKRSLMGDALSHATLPGIAVAFMVMVLAGGAGKFLPGLLAGAAVAGLLGVGAVLAIRNMTRLKDDAALGIVLSVFFGIGVALLGMIQAMPQGSAAGLESFIYGKTASIVHADLLLILGVAGAVAVACALFYKELTLLCFDEGYAGAQGWPVLALDLTMMTLVTAVTVIGLQAVGLILIIALLIIPPAAARFWTERLGRMMLGAAAIGAVSGWLGASLSALVPRLPAGAIIVIVAAAIFLFSMICGASRGVLVRTLGHWALTRTIARQHLLRALYERHEQTGQPTAAVRDLLAARSWSPWRLRWLLGRAEREGLVARGVDGETRLTDVGLREAKRVVRNPRLWEMYLITHADIAPSHVDRDADQIEHVLGPEMVAKLESLVLRQRAGEQPVPASPHILEGPRA
jgi:manganese/zinc/iron transport system permease protein